MPESDEDYERRNREKFARERDYGDRSRGRDFIDRFNKAILTLGIIICLYVQNTKRLL